MSDPNNQNKIKYCSYCGSEIRGNAQFCFACGHRFDENPLIEPSQPMPTDSVYSTFATKAYEIKERIAVKMAQKKKEYELKKAAKIEARRAKKLKMKQKRIKKKKAKKSYAKGIFVGIFISLVAFSIGGFFVIGFMTQGVYEDSFTYYYNLASPASIEECIIYGDTAGINIQYNSTPVDYIVKVDVDISVSGLFVSGKSYENFYNPISWKNTSSAEFSLTGYLWSWIDPTSWFKIQNNLITVTLRTDVVYKLSATSITGGISLVTPENTTIDELNLKCVTGGVRLNAAETNFTKKVICETTTGGVVLDFANCTFNDDIQGNTITGGVEFNSYNPNYTQNINLNLGTTTGGIVMNIQQYSDMSANVTGTARTVTGGVSIDYRDTISDIGAKFTGTTVTGDVFLPSGSNFTLQPPDSSTSQNYNTANTTYTITASTTSGNVNIAGICTT